MRTFDSISALRTAVRSAREDRRTIGFVPTMGALHAGHVALLQRARTECDYVVASVFVNPTQFGPGEDYERYPRDLRADSRIAQAAGVDALFAPTAHEMYPGGPAVTVDVPDLAARWEGAVRPGHFRGVATVCTKLFNIVQPDRAYFGQKDYQQLKVIQRLVADLFLPLVVVPVATVREEDGLALSSRNRYLTPEERTAATVLYAALSAVLEMFRAGERDPGTLTSALRDRLASEPLARVDYAVIADAETLEPVGEAVADRAVALVAARFGDTRLIDNMVLDLGASLRTPTNS